MHHGRIHGIRSQPFNNIPNIQETMEEEEGEEHQRFSVAGIIVTAKDGHAVVEQEQDEGKKQSNANRGATDTVDSVRFTGGEDCGNKGATVRGQELDGQEQYNRQKKETHRT